MEFPINNTHHDHNTYGITVPYSFAKSYMPIYPVDIKFAIHQGIFCNEAVGDYALDMLEQDSENSDTLIDLVLNYRNMVTEELDSVLDTLQRSRCTEPDLLKFCDLLLTWVYENQNLYPDPLLVAEFIYEDFDAPTEVSEFIRYMPMQGCNLGSKELNEGRMMERWGAYVRLRTAYWRRQMENEE